MAKPITIAPSEMTVIPEGGIASAGGQAKSSEIVQKGARQPVWYATAREDKANAMSQGEALYKSLQDAARHMTDTLNELTSVRPADQQSFKQLTSAMSGMAQSVQAITGTVPPYSVQNPTPPPASSDSTTTTQ